MGSKNTPNVVITGVKEIDIKLRRLQDEKKVKALVTKCMKAGMSALLKKCQENVPKDKGNWAKAIKIRVRRSRKGLFVVIDVTRKNLAKVVPNAETAKGFYPAHVEEGTKFQEAQHPMEKSFDEAATQTRDATVIGINAAIMQELKK